MVGPAATAKTDVRISRCAATAGFVLSSLSHSGAPLLLRRDPTTSLRWNNGLSQRQIAQVTGAGQATISRDLSDPKGSKNDPNGSLSKTRALLSQSPIEPDRRLTAPFCRFSPPRRSCESRQNGHSRPAPIELPPVAIKRRSSPTRDILPASPDGASLLGYL
jgi:hypothetical protein